jgi:hypothetical protein
MENSTLEQKQSYLRKEILEADLDGAEFMTFLVKQDAEKGDNLDNWNCG